MLFAIALTTSTSLGADAEAFGVLANISPTPSLATEAGLNSSQVSWISALDTLASAAHSAVELGRGVAGYNAATAALPLSSGEVARALVSPTVVRGEVRSGRSASIVTVTRAVSAAGAGAVTVAGQAANVSSGVIARPVTAPASITSLRGAALLQRLSLLSSAGLTKALAEHPELVSTLLAAPPSAVATSDAWASTPAANREVLQRRAPRLVGALEGVPYAARNSANRVYLAQSIRSIEHRLASGVGREEQASLQTRLHMLDQVKLAITPEAGGLPRQLISFDPAGEGRAVISVGDLSSAKYVSYLVPGMFYGVDARVVPWTSTAAQIASQQSAWLKKLGTSNSQRTGGVAVVSWIGYQTPTLVNVAAMADARVGGRALASSLDGLSATRATSYPYVTVLAHSYGATAALLALQRDDLRVNALAMVGSPGSPATSVKQLHVSGTVWVGAASWDPIPESGVFGSQPTASSYGAKSMGVDGGVDQLTSKKLVGAFSHNDYFAANGETLRNFALIGIDEGAYVMAPNGSSVALGAGRSGTAG